MLYSVIQYFTRRVQSQRDHTDKPAERRIAMIWPRWAD